MEWIISESSYIDVTCAYPAVAYVAVFIPVGLPTSC